ncbi:MAG: hypothetical protein JO144_01940 [Actinobacteria bacterium]|nr:hypothetical protein [Actinomycetota bacterium]
MKRGPRVSAAAACLLGLSACSGGGSSDAGMLSDQQAITASGAIDCVQRPATVVVRGQYECGDGLTVSTFNTAVARMAMAQVETSSGAEHIVKQGTNWLLTADN